MKLKIQTEYIQPLNAQMALFIEYVSNDPDLKFCLVLFSQKLIYFYYYYMHIKTTNHYALQHYQNWIKCSTCIVSLYHLIHMCYISVIRSLVGTIYTIKEKEEKRKHEHLGDTHYSFCRFCSACASSVLTASCALSSINEFTDRRPLRMLFVLPK